jgi:hypothetical protein
MAGITISKDSSTLNQHLAAQVAQELGYCCLADEVISQAASTYQVSEGKLKQALHTPPRFLDRFTYGRDRLLTYIKATLLSHMLQDNVVYCGLGGHFYLQGVPQVLKVGIDSSLDQGHLMPPRPGQEQARPAGDDEEHPSWSRRILFQDGHDASLYDLVLNPGKVGQERAVEMICQASKLADQQNTPESQRQLRDLALAAKVRAKLMLKHPNVRVSVQEGVVTLDTRANGTSAPHLLRTIVGLAKEVKGVAEVQVKMHLGALYH